MILEDDIMIDNEDSDDDRMSFVDAEIEEITDRIIQEFRRKRRPLRAEELDKVSHGMVDNLKESVLSNVMAPAEYQYLAHSSREFGQLSSQRPKSRKILLRSLIESQRSGMASFKDS